MWRICALFVVWYVLADAIKDHQNIGFRRVDRCHNDRNCKDGLVCLNYWCTPIQCKRDGDCRSPRLACFRGRCMNRKRKCNSDMQCGQGNICEKGFCVFRKCWRDQDCGSGNRCDRGRCVNRPKCIDARHCGTESKSMPSISQCQQLASTGNKPICNACPVAPAITTTSAPPKPVYVRLPKTIVPDLYTLELKPNMYNMEPATFTFEGSVKIRMLCIANTRNITLHYDRLNITTVSILEEGGGPVQYSEMTTDNAKHFLIFHLTRELTARKFYTIELSFIGPLKNDLLGLYYSSYTYGNETRYVAATILEPTSARKIFPCFDEPELKAKFDTTLVHKKDQVALSNTEKISTENRGGDWVADKFARTVTMPTYLLAFIFSDFKYTETLTKNNVVIRAWARPEAVSQTSYAAQVCADVTTELEEYFKIPYPLKKQDNFPIPDSISWAMENWGLITYREQTLLYDTVDSSEVNKQTVARVVTHELGHMWFGNLVSPAWWDHLWLNEGFATYIEFKAVDYINPDWKMMEHFISEIFFVFHFDSLMSSRSVLARVSLPAEIFDLFDPISYEKSGAIIRMMKFFLGEEIWLKGLIRYLNQQKFGVATQDDLWYALGNQSMMDNGPVYDIKDIMDTWTIQKNYPVVMVDRKRSNRITITQSRYLRLKGEKNADDDSSSPYGYRWEIPFSFTTSSSANFNQTYSDIRWLRRNSLAYEIQLDPYTAQSSWIIGNTMMYGYYRVNYDENNWYQIIKQLNTDHTVIHVMNRAQIINDAFNLAISEDLKMEIALKTLEYLYMETEYLPWKTAITELTYISNMLERKEIFGDFSMYIKKKMSGVFSTVGLNNAGASHYQSVFRSMISEASCMVGVQTCVDKAKDLYKRWMSNPYSNPIDASVRSAVYCAAIRDGSAEEWMFALKQYKISNVAHEKLRLLHSLACTKQVWLLSRLMKMSIDTNYVRIHDMGPVIEALTNNEIATPLVWSFVKENWKTISTVYGLHLPLIVPQATKKFNTEYQLKQLTDFIEEYQDKGTVGLIFKQAVEQTKINIQWMKNNYNILERWLRRY